MKKLIQKMRAQKKIIIIILLLLIGFAVYFFGSINKNLKKMADLSEVTYFPQYPAVDTKNKNAELIKRGEYLTKAGDCIACHTNTNDKEKAKAFAGGLPMVTPFGTIYVPNITPDKETGIGNWTEEQFIKAMREGISPSGHYYYPAFPYLYFSKVSTEDLKAIKAYLDNIPAVNQKNRQNEMTFPFNWRFLQLGWRIIFFNPENTGPYKYDPEESALWNRGAYIVEGLGHCAMCHTPSYHLFADSLSLGAPIRKYDLTGAKIQGYLAPNISKSNLSHATDQEVIDVFTKNKMIGGGKIKGPMLEVNEDSLKYISHEDLSSITTYLKAVESLAPPLPSGGALGKSIYEAYCSGCHASGAGGAPKYGDPATWEPAMKNGMDSVYTNAIKGIGGMPAKGTCLTCSDDQIKEAVDYMVLSLKGKTSHPSTALKPKKLTLEDGKRIYDQNCSVCHNVQFKGAPKPGDMQAWKSIVDAGFVEAYLNVLTGRKGHPPHGACEECSDAELKAAIKYMLQESTTTKDFSLW